MNTQYEFEDLEDYLNNRMSSSDRASFEQALKTDEGLQRRLEALQAESKVLRLLRKEYLLEQLETWSEEALPTSELKTDSTLSVRPKTVPSKWILWALLAFFGLFLGYFVLNKYWFKNTVPANLQLEAPILAPDTPNIPQNTPVAQGAPQILEKQVPPQSDARQPDYKAIAASTYIDEDFSPTLMGSEDNKPLSDYDQAVRFYEEKAYEKALVLLKAPKKGQESEYQYLRGYVYYQMGQYTQAENEFRSFRNMQNSDRQLDAIWCEVFCLTRQLPNAREQLDRVLQEITANPQHAYFREARNLQLALGRH